LDASEWPRLLTDPAVVTGLYDRVPELAEFRLLSLHADERGTSVTVGFERYALPERPPPAWRERGLNAFQFFLRLDDVTDLRITGWHGTPPASVTLGPGAGSGVRFRVEGPRHDVRVAARTASVAHVRAFLGSLTAE
jgi:hypothetical protein